MNRYQQKRERLNLRSKVKRRLIAKLFKRVRKFKVRRGSVMALVVRRVKRGTMATSTFKV